MAKIFTRTEIEDRILEIVTEKLGIEEGGIALDSDLINEWGADSLDAVEILMEIEAEFQVVVDDDKTNGERTRTIEGIAGLTVDIMRENGYSVIDE